MDLKDLLVKNRSYRRFIQKESISEGMLREWVNRCRLIPSAANLQPLRFMIVRGEATCIKVFSFLRWAAYLKEWQGPQEGEQPSAYIIIMIEGKAGPFTAVDVGIAMQTILLSAVEMGYGGCAIGSFDRDGLCATLEISKTQEVILVIALGKPLEKVVLEEVKDNDIKYWRDTDQVHHVPKRRFDDVLIKIFN